MTELCCMSCGFRYIVGPRDENCSMHILPLDIQFPRCPYCEDNKGKRIWVEKPTVILYLDKNDEGTYQCDTLFPNNKDSITYHCNRFQISTSGCISTQIVQKDGAVIKGRTYIRYDWERYVVKDGRIMTVDYFLERYSRKEA